MRRISPWKNRIIINGLTCVMMVAGLTAMTYGTAHAGYDPHDTDNPYHTCSLFNTANVPGQGFKWTEDSTDVTLSGSYEVTFSTEAGQTFLATDGYDYANDASLSNTGTGLFVNISGGVLHFSASAMTVSGQLPLSTSTAVHLALRQGGEEKWGRDFTLPPITCAPVPTVTIQRSSVDATALHLWFTADRLVTNSDDGKSHILFDVSVNGGTDSDVAFGTAAVTPQGGSFTGVVDLPLYSAKISNGLHITVIGAVASDYDEERQSFGPIDVIVGDGVAVSSSTAKRSICGPDFTLDYTLSGHDTTHTYAWTGSVGSPAVAVSSADLKPTTDPMKVTAQKISGATALSTSATTFPLTLVDKSVTPARAVATVNVTLPACSGVSGAVVAGGSLSSDPVNTKPSSSNPLVATVMSPVAGEVTIAKGSASGAVAGWSTMGVHADITAPKATASHPIRLTFAVSASVLPSGRYVSDLGVFRNGTLVGDCTGSTVAFPDPCVTSSTYADGVVTLTVLTSQASAWDVMAAKTSRLAGADRYGTAVEISKAQFADKSASAVVVATGTDYPDALVAAPIAKAKNAPLLLNSGSTLRADVKSEIQRILASGSTVYVVGGSSVVPAAVVTQLEGLGYKVSRVSGVDRFGTATAVAALLGNPTMVLLATGTDFPDALAAGVAAAKTGTAVLLTNGTRLPDATSHYLTGTATTVYAVGGPAAAAAPVSATELVGTSRYETALAVAEQFFPRPTSVGVATGLDFPDALSGGALLARAGAPLILSATNGPSSSVSSYLTSVKASVTSAHLFGGSSVLTNAAAGTIATTLALK